MHDLDRTQVGLAPDSYGTAATVNEDEQMQLASDLMEVNSEEEFEDFLGDLISQGAKALGGFISSPTGNALGSVLKGAAKQLLPVAGQALGGFIGGPAGAQIGGQLASAASGMFEAEAEAEEQEWEAANTFVKLATDAVKNAAAAPPGSDPVAVAKSAVVEAAKVHAPAIVPAIANGRQAGRHHGRHHRCGETSGQWVRDGRKIILHGV